MDSADSSVKIAINILFCIYYNRMTVLMLVNCLVIYYSDA